MRVRVFYHDKCFDGAASAALFSRFYRERVRRDAEFQYSGLVHRAGALFDEAQFDGDENAIVDFKYSNSPRITWWFDHHQSAFLSPEDAAHFRAYSGGKRFYDPEFKSCTKLIAMVVQRQFGFDPAPAQELIEWADIVDGAQFADARTAVEVRAPALKLTMVIETNQDTDFAPRLIPLLAYQPLAEVIKQPFVSERIPPLIERHERNIQVIRERADVAQGVIFFDVTDQEMEGYSKFIPYYLHPKCDYSVGLSKSSFRVKVSVGSNPWTKTRPEDMANLAVICERYGGGGHARVGAISFEPNQFERARNAAKEIVEELRSNLKK